MEEGVISKVETPYYEFQGESTRKDHDTFGFYEVKGDFNSNEECFSCSSSLYGDKSIEVDQNKNTSE